MKRQSHSKWAQRKFAQGHMPPSNSVVLTQRDETELRSPALTVQKTPLSASSLMDLVAFNGLHDNHVQPYVLLQRLDMENGQEPTNAAVQQNTGHATPSVKTTTSVSTQTLSSILVKKNKRVQFNDDTPLTFLKNQVEVKRLTRRQTKSVLAAQTNGLVGSQNIIEPPQAASRKRCAPTRSRSIARPNIINKTTEGKKPHVVTRKRSTRRRSKLTEKFEERSEDEGRQAVPFKRPTRRRARLVSWSHLLEEQYDDEEPQADRQERSTRQSPRGRVRRSLSSAGTKTLDEHSEDEGPHADLRKTRQRSQSGTPSSKPQENSEDEGPHADLRKKRRKSQSGTSSNKLQENSGADEEPKKITSKKSIRKKYRSVANSKLLRKQAEKVLQLGPRKRSSRASSNITNIEKPSEAGETSDQGLCRSKSVEEDEPSIEASQTTPPSKNDDISLDAVAQIEENVICIPHTPEFQHEPCCSNNYLTVREVINATPAELAARCNRKECSACRRVNKVIQLSSLVQKPDVNGTDVYSFDVDESNSSTLNLDLFRRDSKHIVEITSSEVPSEVASDTQETPSQAKRIMLAKLVPRNSANNSTLSLVDHENLLDELIDTLVMNKIPAAEPEPEPSSTTIKEAPVFYPTIEEFQDPIEYLTKTIMSVSSEYGICKIVPPKGFVPSCTVDDKQRFKVSNQYIARMFTRWGTAAREMCAIRAHLASQSVNFTRAPFIGSIEANLPKLFYLVQKEGGLKRVIEKKKWGRIAQAMRYTTLTNPEKRLDSIYVKYLLPYDCLDHNERQKIFSMVENSWYKKNKKMQKRALSPLHRQKRMLGEIPSEGETSDEEVDIKYLEEAEDCIVKGRLIPLSAFKKIATTVMQANFRETPSVDEVEALYWKIVLMSSEHICVNSASIDTGREGYGFSINEEDPYSKHPWNLKMLSQNEKNVLRILGPVLGVTVPTLHLGMLFSTSCWHRDPHGLPWIEYMHEGPPKIWYGIPNQQNEAFRKAVTTLCPSFCQNKAFWLASDITMIPPDLLAEHNVVLSKIQQNPGEFVVVCPKAYSSSICTGYTVSESVYFATNSWLRTVGEVFNDVRASCEPTMFSLEHLLVNANEMNQLPEMGNLLIAMISIELGQRKALVDLGVITVEAFAPDCPALSSYTREQDECVVCRTSLYWSTVQDLVGKGSNTCLQHALKMLERQTYRSRLSNCRLVLKFGDEKLRNIRMNAVSKQLHNDKN